jgi:hypothetical protein
MSLTISSQGKTPSVAFNTNATPPPAPAAKVEAAPVAAPATVEVPAKQTMVSPKLAELAQRDKATRESQRKWEADKAAWEAEKSKYIPIEQLKQNPLKLLEQAGVTYDQLTQHAIKTVDPVQNKLMTLEQKLAEYEKRFATIDQDKVQATETQRQSAAKQIAYEASKMADAPELEVFKAFGDEGHELVTKKIFDYYDETGNLLDVAEAVKAVNAELTEELKTRFGSLSLFKQLAEPKAVETPTTTTQTTTQARTLTNAMTPPSGRKFTNAEKRERAIRAMRGEKLD